MLLILNAYNYRVSQARRCVENAFEIFAVCWQIFYGMMHCEPDLAERIVKAAVVLHNFLQSGQSDLGDKLSSNGKIIGGLWRQIISGTFNSCRTARDDTSTGFGSNNLSKNARLMRLVFRNYFNTAGSVEWQWPVNQWELFVCCV